MDQETLDKLVKLYGMVRRTEWELGALREDHQLLEARAVLKAELERDYPTRKELTVSSSDRTLRVLVIIATFAAVGDLAVHIVEAIH